MMRKVTITYLGHSCFCLEAEGFRMILDPYEDGTVPGLDNLRAEAEAVFCSHDHFDHNFTKAVTLTGKGKLPCAVTELATDHDDQGGALRGSNTIRIFDFGGLRIAHMGDIGRALRPDEIHALHGVDCLLIPVGGFFTVDAAQAKEMVDQIQPRVTIPMHYRTETSGFDAISRLEDFTGLFDAVVDGGDTLELTENTPAQVLVLHKK